MYLPYRPCAIMEGKHMVGVLYTSRRDRLQILFRYMSSTYARNFLGRTSASIEV